MFPDLLNVRDLGGYPTTDGSVTRRRSLLRADDLAQLSPEGLQALTDYGIETVLDLRWPEEIAAAPSPVPRRLPRVRYVSVSLLAAHPEEWGALGRYCAKEEWKCTVLERLQPQLKSALAVISEADPGPLLFHCVAGKDRTGVIAALLLALADVVPAAIAADYAASTENLREAYLRRYPDGDPQAIIEAVRCPEDAVYNMLDYLQRAGGTSAYLAAIGLGSDEIGPGRQSLAELHRGRADGHQRRRIFRRRGYSRAEPRDPRKPPDRPRRKRVFLDAAQRAVPGQCPAPFQQTPQMGDAGGQIFQPEWMVTSPPSIGSAAARANPACPTIALNAAGFGNRWMLSTR